MTALRVIHCAAVDDKVVDGDEIEGGYRFGRAIAFAVPLSLALWWGLWWCIWATVWWAAGWHP